MTIRFASTWVTVPFFGDRISMLELIATSTSIPVPTSGGSVINSGTACRCMLEPINARLASSCSKKGIKPAETPTIWLGRHVDVLHLVDRHQLEIRAIPGNDGVALQMPLTTGASAGAR